MYFMRKTFELAVCLFGYWLGRGVGGWGGGVLLGFAALCLSSWGWEWFALRVFKGEEQGSPMRNFLFGAVSSLIVAVAAFVLWGK